MVPPSRDLPLASLYDEDETAWLERSAQLIAERRFEDLDAEHLSEFLRDMAKRDRREVLSRLTVLLVHLLKWDHQPELRSNSWLSTVAHQRDELRDLLESGTLRRYAEDILALAYERARRRAALETGLGEDGFPADCPRSLDGVLGGDETPGPQPLSD